MRRFSASAARSVDGGWVFGMSRKLVTPPHTAANDSVAKRRLVREPRLAAMDLVVDEPRQQVLAAEIDRRRAGRHGARADALDAIAANQHVGRDDAPLVDELRVGQQ